jgi:redox-sensitive bicupin YhaK (pirin superfamily)
MTLASAAAPGRLPGKPGRRIVRRTRGRSFGPGVRLMSPSDLGQLMKPFVFLDLFDYGLPFEGGLHPHSGIATLTYVLEGSVTYIDPDNVRGKLTAGGIEWMRAGHGMWHGGGLDGGGRTRGFQLWIALPPELELGPTVSIYQAPEDVPRIGPARVLLGSYNSVTNSIEAPSPINYLAVHLKAGERFRYEPPTGHTVFWTAIGAGTVSVPDELHQGEIAAFEPSPEATEFYALSNAEFVIGSAASHEHDLFLGTYSVHTSAATLHAGESRILSIQDRLLREGRL